MAPPGNEEADGAEHSTQPTSKASLEYPADGRTALAPADREGQAKSITDLAEQEDVTDAYVCRLLPLTCLAPDIVEGILDGRQPKGLRLAGMLGNGPLAWEEQRIVWSFSRSTAR